MSNFEERPLGALIEERDRARMVHVDSDSPYIHTSTTLASSPYPSKPFKFSSTDSLYEYETWYVEGFYTHTKLTVKLCLADGPRVSPGTIRAYRRAWRPIRRRLFFDMLVLYMLFFFLSASTLLREILLAFVSSVTTACSKFLENYIFALIIGIVHPVIDYVYYFIFFLCKYSYAIFLFARPYIGTVLQPFVPGRAHADHWDDPAVLYANLVEPFFHMIPGNFHCAGFIWSTVLVLDIFLILVWFAGFAGHHTWERVPFYGYAVLKGVTLALPLLYITPVDRLFFWPIVVVVIVIESAVMRNVIEFFGAGFEWKFARWTIYRRWYYKFRYQSQTSNSEYYMKFGMFMYPVIKTWLVIFDPLCDRIPRWQNARYLLFSPKLHLQRLLFPRVGTTGFATWRRPQGYKTPRMLAKNERKITIGHTWDLIAEYYSQRATRHQARTTRLWEAYRDAATLEVSRLTNAKKFSDEKFYDYMTKVYLQQPMEAEAFIWWHQGMRNIPLRHRHLIKVPGGQRWRSSLMDGRPFGYTLYAHQVYGPIYKPNPYHYRHAKASVLPDLSYVNALLEQDTAANLKYGLLFILAVSSLTVYSIILAGWSSNSKYAFIGALRSAAQMISYEVAISLLILPVVLMAGSLNITMIVYMQSITVWFVFPLLPAAVLFIIAMLAETNRTPFDLPEAEAELVAGYNVDYSALPFAMFFLGEYCNMILISVLFCLLFLGGWTLFGVYGVVILVAKASVVWFYFIHVRATLPRYRYDQLMDNGWKIFLPIAGGFFIFVVGALIGLDALPVTTELPVQESSRFALRPQYLLSILFFPNLTFLRYKPPDPSAPRPLSTQYIFVIATWPLCFMPLKIFLVTHPTCLKIDYYTQCFSLPC